MSPPNLPTAQALPPGAVDPAGPDDQPLDFRSLNKRREPVQWPRWLFLLVAVVGLSMGPLLAGLVSETLPRGWESRRWPTADGRILRGDVKTQSRWRMNQRLREEVSYYAPRLEYAFFLNGERVTGERITLFGDDWTEQMRPASRVVEKRLEQPLVAVAYDPADPTINCLEPGTRPIDWGLAAGAVALIGAGLAAARRWWVMGATAYAAEDATDEDESDRDGANDANDAWSRDELSDVVTPASVN